MVDGNLRIARQACSRFEERRLAGQPTVGLSLSPSVGASLSPSLGASAGFGPGLARAQARIDRGRRGGRVQAASSPTPEQS